MWSVSQKSARSLHQPVRMRRPGRAVAQGPYLPTPPNVPLLRALWSLLDGIWGLLKGSWGVLVMGLGEFLGTFSTSAPATLVLWFGHAALGVARGILNFSRRNSPSRTSDLDTPNILRPSRRNPASTTSDLHTLNSKPQTLAVGKEFTKRNAWKPAVPNHFSDSSIPLNSGIYLK